MSTSIIAITLIALALAASAAFKAAQETMDSVIDLEKACTFLKNQYVSDIGLLRAAYRPWVADYYRAYINDNILAVNALTVCGEEDLANRVLATLTSNYRAYLDTGRHEVLIGQPIPDKPLGPMDVVMGTIGNITIIAELRNESEVLDLNNYADWLFLESINSLIKGNETRAWELFNKAMEMWDGYGFMDAAFNGTYDTYKLALAVYAYRALGEPLNYRDEISDVLDVLARTQDPESGGVFTGYKIVNGSIKVGDDVSDRNAETTSIVILALFSQCPENIAKTWQSKTHNPITPLSTTAVIASALAIGALLLVITLHKYRT